MLDCGGLMRVGYDIITQRDCTPYLVAIIVGYTTIGLLLPLVDKEQKPPQKVLR